MSTIAEIYNRLAVSKASMQELHYLVTSSDIPGSIQDTSETLVVNIKSGSKVANWRLWLWIMAVASWTVENLFTAHKTDITAILASKRPHTLRWYAEETKKFQFGYALKWINNMFQYDRDDPDSRIVKYAAASERNSKILLKVAREVSGEKTQLLPIQKAALVEFWNKYRDAGVKVEIVSLPADLLKANLTIVRDRLVLDSENRLLRDSTVNPIKDAIAQFGLNLEFDGIIHLSKLVDAIQGAEGVVDVKLISAYSKPAGGNYTLIDMQVEAESGYFIMSYTDSNIVYQDLINVEVLPL